MRLFALTALTIIAFAANSVLNRMALAGDLIDPVAFGTIRLISGAGLLIAMILITRRSLRFDGRRQVLGTVSLIAYIYGFSTAYTLLDAGIGALILFGTVQVTMFSGAVLLRENVPFTRWFGAGLALAGLAWLMWPSGAEGSNLPALQVALMIIAGIGWGLYSLAGRGAGDPLTLTGVNFACAAVLGVLLSMALPAQIDATETTGAGLMLAVLSGAVTSGLGYALWYAILPRLPAAVAAVSQLTVPALAMAGGMVFLGEDLTLRFVMASALIFAGVAISLRQT